MIFNVRSCVLLLFLAAFVYADNSDIPTNQAVSSEKNDPADPQPIPASSTTPPSSSTVTPDKKTTTTSPTTKPSTTSSTELPTTTSSTKKPTTTTTTASPPTTTASPPTTTAPPKTTTPPPPPPKTTTPPPPPPPTTPSTTTSTAAPTTPPPAPTTPQPHQDNWVVTGVNDTVCITANMVIKITVPYKSTANKTIESSFMVEHVQNATATGTCAGVNNTAESLVLTWPNVTATFSFFHNASAHTYALNSVSVAILVNNYTFPNNTMTNVTEVKLAHNGDLFSIPVNNSYTCATVAPLSLTGMNNTVSGKLTVAHVRIQAFGVEKTGKFRAPLDCASTETPDIVPIAVGLVLAGLVVIVLVAYLVGRRRAQARGYLSM